jgi:hypothetical protein
MKAPTKAAPQTENELQTLKMQQKIGNPGHRPDPEQRAIVREI